MEIRKILLCHLSIKKTTFLPSQGKRNPSFLTPNSSFAPKTLPLIFLTAPSIKPFLWFSHWRKKKILRRYEEISKCKLNKTPGGLQHYFHYSITACRHISFLLVSLCPITSLNYDPGHRVSIQRYCDSASRLLPLQTSLVLVLLTLGFITHLRFK